MFFWDDEIAVVTLLGLRLLNSDALCVGSAIVSCNEEEKISLLRVNLRFFSLEVGANWEHKVFT